MMVLLRRAKIRTDTKLTPTAFDSQYWRMHFAAVLLCLHDHQNLEVRPQALVPNRWPGWALHDFRGSADRYAFPRMRASIQNWGAQYLLADILLKNVHGLCTTLVRELSDAHNLPLKPLSCVVAGRDSAIGDAFLRSSKARVLGNRRRRVSSSREFLVFTDLCLLTHLGDPEDTIAIFGEVEGNHGDNLWRPSYWESKSEYSLFAIGLSSRQQESLKIGECSGRIIITMGAQQNVFSDLQIVVNWVERIIESGPSERLWRSASDPELRDAIALVVDGWQNPVVEVLHTLGYPQDGVGGLIGVEESHVPTIWMPDATITVVEPQIIIAK
jgi:hypothetical protein